MWIVLVSFIVFDVFIKLNESVVCLVFVVYVVIGKLVVLFMLIKFVLI